MASDAQLRERTSSNGLLDAPILPTLVTLALPNILALGVQSLAAVAETTYIGILGTEPLAAMALVFPTIVLTQMMSSGAMGGGVSSAISRALGAGDWRRARSLAMHALAIGSTAGVIISSVFFVLAPTIFSALGGKGEVLADAIEYSRAFFAGAVAVWLFNSLISIVRGSGNMRLPSATIIAVGVIQIGLGAGLALGLAGLPRLGLPGVALAQVAAHAVGGAYLIWALTRERSRLRLAVRGTLLTWDMFRDILKVGALACLSPIQSILVVVLLARFAATYGTEALAGFGIGIRLELLLVPIAFAIGIACVPMVGMAIGAGKIARARRIAWTGAMLSGALIGGIGIVAALDPGLWGGLFTRKPEVLSAVDSYLRLAGIGFPAYGVGLCLYFASQGSGKILGPVLAGTVRLALVIIGGWWFLSGSTDLRDLAGLVMVAMMVYGVATIVAVRLTRWGEH